VYQDLEELRVIHKDTINTLQKTTNEATRLARALQDMTVPHNPSSINKHHLLNPHPRQGKYEQKVAELRTCETKLQVSDQQVRNLRASVAAAAEAAKEREKQHQKELRMQHEEHNHEMASFVNDRRQHMHTRVTLMRESFKPRIAGAYDDFDMADIAQCNEKQHQRELLLSSLEARSRPRA